jgi:hypothetical protein
MVRKSVSWLCSSADGCASCLLCRFEGLQRAYEQRVVRKPLQLLAANLHRHEQAAAERVAVVLHAERQPIPFVVGHYQGGEQRGERAGQQQNHRRRQHEFAVWPLPVRRAHPGKAIAHGRGDCQRKTAAPQAGRRCSPGSPQML